MTRNRLNDLAKYCICGVVVVGVLFKYKTVTQYEFILQVQRRRTEKMQRVLETGLIHRMLS
jgi:hypothetical protein